MEYDQTYKRDAGKPRMSLLFEIPRALEEVVGAMENGIAKYGIGTWDKVQPFTRYFDSMMRHPFDAAKKDNLFARDDESGRLHLAHECLNMLYLLELHLREQEKIDEHLRCREAHDGCSTCECGPCECEPCEAEPASEDLREKLEHYRKGRC